MSTHLVDCHIHEYLAGCRIADLAMLPRQIAAWSSDVNGTQRGVDWQMRINEARRKLKSVYPTTKL